MQSIISMHGILMLGGSRHMPLWEKKIRYSEVAFGSIFGKKIAHIHFNLIPMKCFKIKTRFKIYSS